VLLFMSVQTQTFTREINMSLGFLFKNITKENCYNLLNQPTQILLTLGDPIFIGDQFFYRNNDVLNEFVFETKNKQYRLIISDFELTCGIIKIKEDCNYKNYRRNCCKKYKKQNYLSKRTIRINNEIDRMIKIETKIKTEIINNLNFTKSRSNSHYKNCENKITGKNVYKKPIFLFELHEITDGSKNRLIDYINLKLNLKMNIKVEFEQLFILLFVKF